ncbi:MAG TPA: hypothetical protein VJC13_02705 [Candidatus Paceibacterota bacterium]
MTTTSAVPVDTTISTGTLLERVLGYQNSAVVDRFVEKLGLGEEEASLLFEDTKRFLYLCGSKRKGDPTLAPSEKVDAGWHEFLLFTEDYQSFCQSFFGRFIHHRPRRTEDPKGDGSDLRNTRMLAIATFGDLSSNWQLPVVMNEDCQACESSCDSGGCSTCTECHN